MYRATPVIVLRLYFLFFFIICINSTAVIVKAPCPDFQVVQNFDMGKFCRDFWYQIARYPDDFEKKGDCVTLTVSFADDNCQFSAAEVSEGKRHFVAGNLTYESKDKTGAVVMRSPSSKGEDVNNAFPLKILTIDYNSFLLAYECRYNETTQMRHEYAWVYARSKKLTDEVSRKLEELYQTADNFIDTNKFIWEHFSDEACKLKV